MNTALAPVQQRGIGVLNITVSTIGAIDERHWRSAEMFAGRGFAPPLLARASFGPGSMDTYAPWVAKEGTTRRSISLYLPYFNLGNSIASAKWSLVVEILLSNTKKHKEVSSGSAAVDRTADDVLRSTAKIGEVPLDWPLRARSSVQGTIAVGRIDLNTTAKLSMAPSSTTEQEVPLVVDKTAATSLGIRFPEKISALVALTFSRLPAQEREVPNKERVGEVPVLFVAATTLFDCNMKMKNATVRLYAGHDGKRGRKLLCSGRRSVIVVHDCIKWETSADISFLFPTQGSTASSSGIVSESAIVIALVEHNDVKVGAAIIDDGLGEPEAQQASKCTVLGSLEVSTEDIVSCGASGRWCPLFENFHTPRPAHRGRTSFKNRRQSAKAIVGEVLVACASLPAPAMKTFLAASTNDRASVEAREARQGKRHKIVRDCPRHAHSRSGESDSALDKAFVRCPPVAKHSGCAGERQGVRMYFHVWDALLPFARPGSAFYLSVYVLRSGSRGQRASTKPALGRSPIFHSCTASECGGACALGKTSKVTARTDSMHVVWDEHLSLSLNEPVEGFTFELRLFDASVDYSTGMATAATATRVYELCSLCSFKGAQPDRDCNSKHGFSEVSSPCILPRRGLSTPTVHRLKECPLRRLETEIRASDEGRVESDHGAVAVRVAALVFPHFEAADRSGEVAAFLQRRADTVKMPRGTKRGPNTSKDDEKMLGAVVASRMSKGRKRPCMLDFTSVEGLFRKFATESSTGAEMPPVDGQRAPETHDDEHDERYSIAAHRGSLDDSRQSLRSEEATLTQDSLVTISQAYFPGRERRKEGVSHPRTSLSQGAISDGGPLTQGTGDREHSHQLSFADFVYWLRGFSDNALGAAGLLASPRTVLAKTEAVMCRSAEYDRNLNSSLRLAHAPAKGLIVGGRFVALESTAEGVVLDRLRLERGVIGGERVEDVWRHHVGMLGRDVMMLTQATRELEDRRSPLPMRNSGGSSARTSQMFVEEEGAAVFDSSAENIEEPYNSFAVNHRGLPLDDAAKAYHSLSGADEEMARLNVFTALQIKREATEVRASAEQLKETLRCTADTLYPSDVAGLRFTSKRQRADSGTIIAQAQDPPAREQRSSRHNRVGSWIQSSPNPMCGHDAFDDIDDKCGQYFGVLRRLTRLVVSFQADLDKLEGRAATFLPRKPIGNASHINQLQENNGADIENAPFDVGAPRSAVALVKRIRRAQNLTKSLPTNVSAQTRSEGTSLGQRVHSMDCFSSPEAFRTGTAAKGAGQQNTSPYSQGSSAHEGLAEGSTSALTPSEQVASMGAPPCSMGKGPLLRLRIEERVWVARAAFQEHKIDLPVTFASTTARQVMDLAYGTPRTGEAGSMRSDTGAIMCSPIDTFVLHVFRAAGGAGTEDSKSFVDVQELAGTGGLETYASEKALWVAVEEGGIVDVDRWVVAAVLWQAIASVERAGKPGASQTKMSRKAATSTTTSAERAMPGIEPISMAGGEARHVPSAPPAYVLPPESRTGFSDAGAHEVAADTIDKRYPTIKALGQRTGRKECFFFVHEATRLWEELCHQVFRRVLVSRMSQDTERRSRLSQNSSCPSSSSTCAEHEQICANQRLQRAALEDDVAATSDKSQHAQLVCLDTVKTTTRTFEHALAQTIGQEGCCRASTTGDQKLVFAQVVSEAKARAKGTTENATPQTLRTIMSIEDILLFAFATAGFAEGSGLSIHDIVLAVKVRRERKARFKADAPKAPARPSPSNESSDTDSRMNTLHHSRVMSAASAHEARAKGDRDHEAVETFCGGHDGCFLGECMAEGGVEEAELHADARSGGRVYPDRDTPQEDQTQLSPCLAGVPAELSALFKASIDAALIRKRQHQQHGGVAEDVRSGSEEERAAEARVSQILDTNRTLGSAAFAEGKTALHHAAARGDDILVRLLLERGCKPHLKDFEGRRACDLTRDLKCLLLVGALKKASLPSAHSLRGRKTGRELAASDADTNTGPHPPHRRSGLSRALASIEFAVSFRFDAVDGLPSAGCDCGDITTANARVAVADQRAGRESGREQWTPGIARWYDVRNKVLYIDEPMHENENSSSITTKISATATVTPARAATFGPIPCASEILQRSPSWESDALGVEGIAGADDARFRSHARHVLAVRLHSCLSPAGAVLFEQLREYSRTWKEGIARALLCDIIVSAAADEGALYRRVFDGVAIELVAEFSREAYHVEKAATDGRAVASRIAAAASALTRAQQARPAAESVRKVVAPVVSLAKTPPATADAFPSRCNLPSKALVHKIAASKLNFRCVIVVKERGQSRTTNEVTAIAESLPAEGQKSRMNATTSEATRRRRQQDRRYLAKLRIEEGVCTVTVNGRSYLTAAANDEPGEGDGKGRPVDLDGGNKHIQSVLDSHGVTLAVCVQTFDVMRDMEDPRVVLDMLAAGVCQLSASFIEEGIDFLSLEQSEQDLLKADILQQLHHVQSDPSGRTTNDDSVDELEWEKLTITMRAYEGVTSVRILRKVCSSGRIRDHDRDREQVISSEAGGWTRPEDVTAALCASQGLPSSPSEPTLQHLLPPPFPTSAINIVTSLMMGCNVPEVLGSLNLGTCADHGRLALIGYSNNVTADIRGKQLTRERTPEEKESVEESDAYRCSLEVAWDRETGGVFVKRLSMERDEKHPRFALRTLGIRGFSISQLPVTLEDIDAVWDQTGLDDTSSAGKATSDNDAAELTPPANIDAKGTSSIVFLSDDVAACPTMTTTNVIGAKKLSLEGREEGVQAVSESPLWTAATPSKSVDDERAIASGKSGSESSIFQLSSSEGQEDDPLDARGGDADTDELTLPENLPEVGDAAGRAHGLGRPREEQEERQEHGVEATGERQEKIQDDNTVVSLSAQPRESASLVKRESDPDEDRGRNVATSRSNEMEGRGGAATDGAVYAARQGSLSARKGAGEPRAKRGVEAEREQGKVAEDAAREDEGEEGVDNQSRGVKLRGNDIDQTENPGETLGEQNGREHLVTRDANLERDTAATDLPAHMMHSGVSLPKDTAFNIEVALNSPKDPRLSLQDSTVNENAEWGIQGADAHLEGAQKETTLTGLSRDQRVQDRLGAQIGLNETSPMKTHPDLAATLLAEALASECGEVHGRAEVSREVQNEETQQEFHARKDPSAILGAAGEYSIGSHTHKETPASTLGALPSTESVVERLSSLQGAQTSTHSTGTKFQSTCPLDPCLRSGKSLDPHKDASKEQLQTTSISGEHSKYPGVHRRDATNAGGGITEGDKPTELDLRGSHDIRRAINDDAGATHHASMTSSEQWTFSPSFTARVVLSTAQGSTQCTVEGSILFVEDHADRATQLPARLAYSKNEAESNAGAITAGATCSPLTEGEEVPQLERPRFSWQGQSCTYIIPAEGNISPGEIDLEDDDAQARLEELLSREYGLTIHDVLELFSPDTDLSSGNAVLDSFTNSICHRRVSAVDEGQHRGDKGAEGYRDRPHVVREAVGKALRGSSDWLEVEVCVTRSHVRTVRVFGETSSPRAAGAYGGEVNGVDSSSVCRGGDSRQAATPAKFDRNQTCFVDCSSLHSPAALREHVLAAGVPSAVVDVMSRSGFFDGPALDTAGVLAALAEQARSSALSALPPDDIVEGTSVIVPALCPGMDKLVRLCVGTGGEKGVHQCTVRVTGSSQDIEVETYSSPNTKLARGATAKATADMVTNASITLQPIGEMACGSPRRSSATSSALLTSAGQPTNDPSDPRIQSAIMKNLPGRSNFEHDSERNISADCELGTRGADEKRFGGRAQLANDGKDAGLKPGDKVEARFGGQSAWFPGVVRAIRTCNSIREELSNLPTVAVDYDDGDTESRIPRVRVRLPGQKQPRVLKTGDEVDFKHGKKIHLARILDRTAEGGDRYNVRILSSPGTSDTTFEDVPRNALMAVHGWPPTAVKATEG